MTEKLFQKRGKFEAHLKAGYEKSKEVKSYPSQSSSMSDEELEYLLLTKLEGKTVDIHQKKDLADFFDETFPEYEKMIDELGNVIDKNLAEMKAGNFVTLEEMEVELLG